MNQLSIRNFFTSGADSSAPSTSVAPVSIPDSLPECASPDMIAAAMDEQLGDILVLGVDPGKLELAVVADTAKTMDEGRGKIRTVRFTAAQKRFSCEPGRFNLKQHQAARDADGGDARREKKEKADWYRSNYVKTPDAVLEMERTLSEHCNKASSSGALGEYVAARAVVLSPLLDSVDPSDPIGKRHRRASTTHGSRFRIRYRLRDYGAISAIHIEFQASKGSWL